MAYSKMTTRSSWRFRLLPVLITVLFFLTSVTGAVSKQPNIVFVLADDVGFNDVGYHGSEIKTPAIDELAASGVVLENYYVQPICTPTRSQLMSGRYQIHTGLQHGIIWPQQPNALPTDSPIIAEKLRECGYATHMVGKWHLGFYQSKYLPWRRGFDSFYGYLSGFQDYYTHKTYYGSKPYLDLRDNNKPVRNETGHYSAHLFTEKAMNVINAHDKFRPLFLFLAYQSVHSPLQVPKEYLDQYHFIKDKTRRTYAGMVSALDEGIGNVTKALKDNGLWDNTVFVFSTDNGGEIYQGASNYPLRGGKASHWEGGVRGVGFVSGPLVKSSGTVNRELIHVSDWYPSLVKLGGGSLEGTKLLDGYDQWETISAGAPSKRKVLLHNIDPLHKKKGVRLFNDTFDTRVQAAIRVGDMKLITGDIGDTPFPDPQKTSDISRNKLRKFLQDNKVKNRKHPDQKNVWLFNITADPNENNDLSDSMPETVKQLLDQLVAFDKTSVPPRFPHNDRSSDPGRFGHVWGPWR